MGVAVERRARCAVTEVIVEPGGLDLRQLVGGTQGVEDRLRPFGGYGITLAIPATCSLIPEAPAAGPLAEFDHHSVRAAR